MDGMPRRVADYASQFGDWNLLISCFSFMLGAAQLVFIYNMVVSWRFGPKAGSNPWRARTIEWLVSSPPPRFNFDEIPRVVGGPYEFGVPGAVHALMSTKEVREHTAQVVGVSDAPGQVSR
jgi:cytochrome c oxidase subunit 1